MDVSPATDISFPNGFIWGTATASHQVEGSNWNNDWWEWEHTPGSGCAEPSGDACDHFHLYADDIRLLAELGFGAYRFSVEWSRVEPEDGEWSRASLEHYRRMCAACLDAGMVPMVTFHHFTTPRWLARAGGWAERTTADRFARYCEKVTAHLGDLIGWACTINEPNIVALMGYLAGVFPPGRRDIALRRAVNEIMIDAHSKGAAAIRAGKGSPPVGLTLSMTDYQAVEGGASRLERIRHGMEDVFLEAAREDDFVGVQAYTRMQVGPDGAVALPEGAETTQMGYEYWPQCLDATVRRAWEVTGGVPVLVTENGIGTADDGRRIDYVSEALRGLRRCIDDGIEVRGYSYWSALDNFEWALGYMPTFGLVAVDRETMERRPKASARWLGEVARANSLLSGGSRPGREPSAR